MLVLFHHDFVAKNLIRKKKHSESMGFGENRFYINAEERLTFVTIFLAEMI
jgi:hypothetical protein